MKPEHFFAAPIPPPFYRCARCQEFNNHLVMRHRRMGQPYPHGWMCVYCIAPYYKQSGRTHMLTQLYSYRQQRRERMR